MVNCGIITLVLYFHSKCRNIVSQHESYQRRSKVSIGKNMLHGMEIWHSRLHCSRISSCTHRSGLFNKLFFCSGEKNGIPSHVLGEIDIQHLPYGDGLHHLFLVSHCGWFIVGERSIKKPMQILTSWISWHDVLMVTCLLRNGIAKAPLLLTRVTMFVAQIHF